MKQSLKRTAFIFYFLSFYVIAQFAWWGFHIIQLTKEANVDPELAHKRTLMVIGEGMVFFLILIFGIWRLRRSIKKELELNFNQTNFLLSVTHELKTPIASNKLFLQTVLKRDLDRAKQNELLEKALNENIRLEQMIDNILNASRLENRALVLHKEQINVKVFLNEIVARYQKNHPDQTFETQFKDDIEFSVDPFVLETIVNNLIENALKYGDDKKPISVELKAGQSIVIRVKDLGPGVSAADQSNIFKKFYRAGNEETRNKKGSGLGLFIASEFSKLHGGTLKYFNNQPKGAIFELTL